MAALLVKIGTDESHEIIQSFITAEGGGVEFLVKERVPLEVMP